MLATCSRSTADSQSQHNSGLTRALPAHDIITYRVRNSHQRPARILALVLLLAAAACRTTGDPAARVPTEEPTPISDPAVEMCPDGASPTFDYGFAALKARLGDTMGTPLSCERAGPLGDSLQQTTTGYARYDKVTNTPTFTRGSEHWALTVRGLVHWSGTALDPPADAQPLDPVDERSASGVPLAASDAIADLHFTYTAGEVRTYISSTRVTVDSPLLTGKAPPPIEIDMRFTYRTVEVHGDGSATILASIDDVSVWSGGKVPTHVPELEHLTVRSVVTSDGSTVSGSGDVERDGQVVGGADFEQLRDSMITFVYPESPLHAADSFVREFPLYLGPSLPRTTMRSVYRFVGLGSLDAVDVARLEENDAVSIGDWPVQNGVRVTDGQLAAHGWNYIGLKDGWPVSGQSDMTLSFVATKSSAPPSRPAAPVTPASPRATFTVHAETSYRLRAPM